VHGRLARVAAQPVVRASQSASPRVPLA
jgi:hypothetical protein